MIHYRINRGVGRAPEIFGLSQKYMNKMVIALLLGFVVFGVCRSFFDSTLISVLALFGTVGAAFFYYQTISVKHGDDGLAKKEAYQKRPRILTTSSRSVFLNLRK